MNHDDRENIMAKACIAEHDQNTQAEPLQPLKFTVRVYDSVGRAYDCHVIGYQHYEKLLHLLSEADAEIASLKEELRSLR